MKKILASNQATLEVPPDLSHLPDTVGALVPLYRACIVRFDAAVRARRFDELAAIYGEASEIIERAFSLERFSAGLRCHRPGSYMREKYGRTASYFRYCFNDVAKIFDRLTRATPGAVPMFGQSGDFIASLSVTRIRFKLDGLCGSIGMSAYDSCAWSFEIHVVERQYPFFSPTGYRSFVCSNLAAGESTDVSKWCVGYIRNWWNTSGAKENKGNLYRVAPPATAPAFAPMEVDEAELACVDCGDDLSQMDEIGECSESGAFRCPACQEKHEQDCAECTPLDGETEEDSPEIDGGFRLEPVAKTSTQLSLF